MLWYQYNSCHGVQPLDAKSTPHRRQAQRPTRQRTKGFVRHLSQNVTQSPRMLKIIKYYIQL